MWPFKLTKVEVEEVLAGKRARLKALTNLAERFGCMSIADTNDYIRTSETIGRLEAQLKTTGDPK